MALDYRTIRYLETRGNSVHIHYIDGKTVIAVPDGRGNFLPGAASAGTPPGEYEPWEPPPEPTDPPPAGSWAHPLSGGTVTSGFGYRWGGFHYGLDISTTTAATGGIVRAPTQMVITRAYDAGEGGNQTAGTYVKGNNGVYTFTFAHGADESLVVSVGETVQPGQPLFTEGATGNVTGTHLHLEIIQGVHADPWAPPYNNGAQFLDPLPILRANGVNI
jgi:murein DD-endopeptidase MepM/ murein hydrolase activator NlpD